jgi:hypothetical protein
MSLDDAVVVTSCTHFTPDKTELPVAIKRSVSVCHCYHLVENGRTYRSTAIASRPEKWQRRPRALEEVGASSELESEVVLCPGLEPFVKIDLRKGLISEVERRGRMSRDDGSDICSRRSGIANAKEDLVMRFAGANGLITSDDNDLTESSQNDGDIPQIY